MRILVAGGTGFLGSSLVKMLVENGHELSLLIRPGSEHKIPYAGNVSLIQTRYDFPVRALDGGLDVLVNCIGIIREFPSSRITFERIHCDIVRYLIELAKINGIERLIQISALGAGPQGKTGYLKTKYKAEEMLKGSNLNVTIFRPSIIYGPGDDFINMIAGFLRKFSIMPVIGNGKYRLQPVHVLDLCSVIVRSIEDNFTHGDIFAIGGPEILTFNEIVETVGDALGKRAIKFHQPVMVMRILSALFGRFAWFPVTGDQITMLFEENYTDDRRLFEHYNIIPRKLGDSLKEYLS